MRIAILDTETTSAEPPPEGVVIEIAITLFDVALAQPIESFASLIRTARGNPAQAINGIDPRLLENAPLPVGVWDRAEELVLRADAIVAHNAAFDWQFVSGWGKPWVCSENDIQWPGKARAGSLPSLALAYGVGVVSAHRASADVDTLTRIFMRLKELGHELKPLFAHALRPKAVYYAQVSFAQKDLAKTAGFRWDPAVKEWWREMASEDVVGLPFKVKKAPKSGKG